MKGRVKWLDKKKKLTPIPNNLQIDKKKWKISLLKKGRVKLNGNTIAGLIKHEKREIQVERNNPEEIWKTLIHEVFHAMFEQYFKGFEGLEHDLIDILEECIYEFLIQNELITVK